LPEVVIGKEGAVDGIRGRKRAIGRSRSNAIRHFIGLSLDRLLRRRGSACCSRALSRLTPTTMPTAEVASFTILADTDVPAPALIGADEEGKECDVPAIVMTRLPGHPQSRRSTTGTTMAGRLNPLSRISREDSVTTRSSTAAWTRWLTRISPGAAASLSREARITTVPIAA
jgi:hypothetical protein